MKNDFMLAKHLAEIRTMAIDTFKLEPIADQWLNTVNHILGCTPLKAAESTSGANEVKKLLKSIQHKGQIKVNGV